MTWQKITDHINGHRIEVESKSGNRYPVETIHDGDNGFVYKWAMGDLAPDELWADVKFPEDGDPWTDHISTGDPSGGAP